MSIPSIPGGLPQNLVSRVTDFGTGAGALPPHPGSYLPYGSPLPSAMFGSRNQFYHHNYCNVPAGNTRNLIRQFDNSSIPPNMGFRNENLQPSNGAQQQLHQSQQQQQPVYHYQPQPVHQQLQLPHGNVWRNNNVAPLSWLTQGPTSSVTLTGWPRLTIFPLTRTYSGPELSPRAS